MNAYTYIQENYDRLTEDVEQIARRVGVEIPQLVAITKSATDEEVTALLSCGAKAMGENRAQLFCHRYELTGAATGRPAMHFVGSLQTNKVKYLIGKAALIQSLDRLSLAQEIERQCARQNTSMQVLLEVNSGREEAKGGALPEEIPALLESVAELPHLCVRGLMTMAPACPDPEESRPYFRDTYRLFTRLCAQGCFATDKPILSMGMSDSYRVAIEEGSNMIRVGHLLFRPAIN